MSLLSNSAVIVFTVIIIAHAASAAYAQDVGLATFHEGVTIHVDMTGSQNVTTSVILQSISTQEIQIPESLERQIREDGRVSSVILTNQERCVLGVVDRSCILINTERDPVVSGIAAIQEASRSVAELYIDEINRIFDTDAAFHSVFVHAAGSGISDAAAGLDIPATGRTTVSVVYVMPMEDTGSMYEKISAILLPGIIRESGGFYDAAKTISLQQNAKMAFALYPLDSHSLLQLKVASVSDTNTPSIDVIRPIEMMGLNALERSDYFTDGFYPLNSIIQVAISSSDPATMVYDSLPAQIPTREVDDELIPIDVNTAGWIFDPLDGKMIHAKYLFGTETVAASEELQIWLNAPMKNNTDSNGASGIEPSIDDTNSEQIIILIAVVAAAVAAAVFYLRGYSGRPARNKVPTSQ